MPQYPPLIPVQLGPPADSRLSPEAQASEDAFQKVLARVNADKTIQKGQIRKDPMMAFQKVARFAPESQTPQERLIDSGLGDAVTGGAWSPLKYASEQITPFVSTDPPSLLTTLMRRYGFGR